MPDVSRSWSRAGGLTLQSVTVARRAVRRAGGGEQEPSPRRDLGGQAQESNALGGRGLCATAVASRANSGLVSAILTPWSDSIRCWAAFVKRVDSSQQRLTSTSHRVGASQPKFV